MLKQKHFNFTVCNFAKKNAYGTFVKKNKVMSALSFDEKVAPRLIIYICRDTSFKNYHLVCIIIHLTNFQFSRPRERLKSL